ncbi:S1C family serine protease [Singulisphaera acidiphila]|nr:serine protease [Singulisphaera acidiphila]
MRSLSIAALVLVLPVASALGQESIPAGMIAEIKASTVLVRTQSAAEMGTGSGFVIRVEGRAVYIATNHHVINLPVVQTKAAVGASVSVVFASGTAGEETKAAEILDSDSSRDLAILKVVAPKVVPKPIANFETAELVETMPVYTFGFPFGAAMAVGKKGSSITIGRGSVSSIRRDDFGRVAAVQIDGALNPGNSGGPVVDAKGRLVGIAVATIPGAHIGMAIPAEELTQMLGGRVGAISVRGKASTKPGMLGVEIEAKLIDPLGRMKSVVLLHAPTIDRAAKPSPNADGTWPPISEAAKVALKVSGHRATGSFEVASDDGARATFMLQVSYIDGSGKVYYTSPTTQRVTLGLSSASARGGRRPSVADDEPKGGFAVGGAKKKGRQAAMPYEPKGGFAQPAAVPQAIGEAIGDEPREVDDLKVIDIKVNAAQVPRCICWSGDGKAFFVLEKEGILRRITLDGVVEAIRLDVGRGCSWLSRSVEGLVLTLGDIHEVWVIDPSTLKVKSKVAVDSVVRAVSSPALSMAFAAGDQRGPGGHLAVVNLKAGKVVREYTPQDFDGDMVGFAHMDVTPDGKYLFSQGGIEQLQRYRIKSDKIALEESSERLASNGQAVEISPDGYYVALPSGGGNGGGAYTINVFKITNLAKPEIVVRAGAYPKALGFDIKSGFLLGQNAEHPLILLKPSGAKVKDYHLSRRKNAHDTARQFVVHPDGGKFLVLTDTSLYLVELLEK